MTVGEAVELGGRALGVSAHFLKVEPVAHIERLSTSPAFGNNIDTIAGGAPDGILDSPAGVVIGVAHAVEILRLATGAEDARDGLLVVEDDGAEVAVDTVVHVKHARAGTQLRVLVAATRDDVAGDCESRADVVATWLANDANRRREVFVQGGGEDGRHGVEGLGDETAADIQSLEVVAHVGGLLEDKVCIADGLEEGVWVGGTGSYVESDACDVQVELLCQGQEVTAGVQTGSKLLAQTAESCRVVGQDAQEELGIWVYLFNLVQLVGVVKGHLLDSLLCGVADIGLGLAGLSVDDARRIDPLTQHHLNLGFGCAVEASAECGEKT